MNSLSKGESPVRGIRVPDDLWEAYLLGCARLERTPAQHLREYMQRVVDACQTNDNN